MSNYIFSETVGTMIPKAFTTRKVLFSKDGLEKYKICKPFKWIWNEDDAVYYREDTDESFKCEMPVNGAKCLTFALGKTCRYLVKIG